MRPVWPSILVRVGWAIAALIPTLACNQPTVPSYVKSICGYIDVGGDRVPPDNLNPDCTSSLADAGMALADAGTTTLTVGTQNPQFVAVVQTNSGGPWQLTVMADGVLTVGGDSGQSISFSSSGEQLPIVVPLTVLPAGGQGTIRTVVGDLARDFQFFVASGPGQKKIDCLQLAGNDPKSVSVLAWAVKPPPPISTSDSDGGTSGDAAGGVGTLTVDIQAALTYCADAGMGVLDGTVSVQGTGGMVPTMSTLSPDSEGRVVIELTGPAVSDRVAAVLTTHGGGSLVVEARQSDFGP
jgi:hypothetical protein